VSRTTSCERAFVVPDAIEPIVAYRYWDLTPDGRLRSPIPKKQVIAWPGQERFEAFCGRVDRSHAVDYVPHPDCSCGIRAYELARIARWGLMLETLDHCSFVPVIGRLKLWGRVVSDSEGHRAQYAYPLELILLSDFSRVPDGLALLRRRLEECYQVPVAAWDSGQVSDWMLAGGSEPEFAKLLS
jgi:hypothetical protein